MKTCVKCGSTEFHASGKCKPCQKARNSSYYKINKERLQEYQRQYSSTNRESEKARAAAWREENPEKYKQQKAGYRERNRLTLKFKSAKYRADNPTQAAGYRSANPEIVRAASFRWSQANKQAVKINCQNRRARMRGERLSKGLPEKLFKLQRGKCACCGKPLGESYHLDHIMPLALGGSNTDDNIQLLRPTCNQQKHAKHPVDFMQSRGMLL